ncbi:unnamed protein product [Ceratitis capitata]|uniref:(Mediterranean fruit fly) hypothetical protein n=1 Tax=Ceratitis capitata TaxID=7213 RepID=A0A811VG40_CERCA|nr:unnamed protein product [Ceratitis capitata]
MNKFSYISIAIVIISLIQCFVGCVPLNEANYLDLAAADGVVGHTNEGLRLPRQHYAQSFPGGYVAGGVYRIPGGVASYAHSAHGHPVPATLNYDYDLNY